MMVHVLTVPETVNAAPNMTCLTAYTSLLFT